MNLFWYKFIFERNYASFEPERFKKFPLNGTRSIPNLVQITVWHMNQIKPLSICNTVPPLLLCLLHPLLYGMILSEANCVTIIFLYYLYLFMYIFLFCFVLFFFDQGFLSQTFTNHRTAGGDIPFTPHYHFHLLDRHLDTGWVTTEERSPLHIASSWTWTRNLWLPNASCWWLSYTPSSCISKGLWNKDAKLLMKKIFIENV